MEKQMTMTTNQTGWRCVQEMTRKIAAMPGITVEMLRKYYSTILEREITTAQMRVLLEVQAAFFAGIMPADYPLLLRAAFCCWFLVALRKCGKMM